MKDSFKELLGKAWGKTKEAFTPRKPKLATVFKLIALILVLGVLFLMSFVIISTAIVEAQSPDVLAVDATPSEKAEYIIVFGALVRADGTLSDMLRDRVETGVRLYKAGVAPKILMSGDSENDDYDETTAMKKYAVEQGVPEEDVICDPYGLSTYDSVWRAKNIYKIESAVLVTQEYHLYRALYISDKLGVKTVGASADLDTYRGQFMRDLREIAARVKDFFLVQTDGIPKYTENK